MSRRKVLFVSHSSRIGGAEVCLLTLVKNLDYDRFEPVVVLPTRGPLRQRLIDLGVRTYISPLEWWIRAPAEFEYKGRPLWRRVQALVRIVEREQPDLVHSNTAVVWEGALAARLAGVPHLWHIHEILPDHPVLRSLPPWPDVFGTFNALSERVVAVSQAVVRSFDTGVDSAKAVVIPNGIEAPEYGLQQGIAMVDSLRQELAFPAHRVLALTIGSVVAEKGHDTLLQAAALVRQRNESVHFVLAGGGDPGAMWALQRKIAALGMQDHVHYLGFRRDVPRLLAGSDLLVLPSYTDAFPLAVLEAMAAGKPVVATASGGAAEMINDGATGFLVPVADPARLADKVLQLAADEKARMAMGDAARARFRENYTAQIYASRMQRVYEQILTEPPPARDADVARREVGVYIKAYESRYYVAQAMARRRPARWQAGRLWRWAKQQARRRLYEVE